jgi:hypothetical protein
MIAPKDFGNGNFERFRRHRTPTVPKAADMHSTNTVFLSNDSACHGQVMGDIQVSALLS